MKMLLIQRELWKHVDGSAVLRDDATAEQKVSHKSKDEKALSTIALSIDPDQQVHIVHCGTARQAWLVLEEIYEPKSRQRIMQLKRQFVRIRLKDDENIESYLNRLKICSDSLREAGAEVKDEDLAYAMLSGLPDTYDALIMTLASLEDEKFTSVEIRKSLSMEYDRRMSKREDEQQKQEVAAYQIKKGKQNTFGKPNKSGKCFSCGKQGHFSKQCRNKDRKGEKGDVTKEKQIALFTNVNDTALEDAWLIDSAATHHVCRHKEWFESLKRIKPEPIGTAEAAAHSDEGSLSAQGVGNIKLRAKINHKTYEIILTNVYYAPNCRRNLMSVAQIEKKGRVLEFKNGSARIADGKTGQRIIEARRWDNLYIVQADVINPKTQDVIKLHSACMTERDVWHRRFCHINNKSIEELRQKGFVHGLDHHKMDSSLCHGCCIGKSTKAPCKRIDGRQSSDVAELIHSDLCGPMPVKSVGGSRYMMTLIDDYSRKTTVYFLKSKDEVVQNIKNYINKIERDKGSKVKRFRTDNGLEYCNKELQGFFDKLGIKHERSCVETPQMNGIAERANRTLMDLVRSMLTSAKIPMSFWAEATSAAAYVRNRMIHANLKDGVPEGIWNGKIPSVRHLKAYGCLAYAHLPHQGRQKLDPRARPCVLVGYSSQTKGYRLWDIKKKEIIQTKHVRFDETKLGYEDAEDTNQALFQFPYNKNSEEEEMLEDTQEDTQQRSSSKIKKEKYVRTEPVQTRSRSIAQGKKDVRDEESSDESDEKIVGASNSEVEKQVTTKESNNPYRRKGKLKDGVELNLVQIKEPQNLEEALSSPQSENWIQAVEEELSNLERLKTWEIVELPAGKGFIDSKWVFKVKRDANGQVARYKARLVARGFTQKEGTDYTQTYAPVARFAVVRLLLAMSVIFGWKTRHIDIKSAYLNGKLAEELYMKLPTLRKNEKARIVKLLRPIYGLKQSGHNWNEALDDFLVEAGFTRLKSSNCTYRYDFCTFLVVYVDDIIIFSRYQKTINRVGQLIQDRFEARDLGEITHFLGVNIERDAEGGVKMNQGTYIRELLERYGLQECRPAYVPLEPGNPMSSKDSPKTDDERQEMKNVPYRELVGSLGYISQCTRPDIAFAVSKLAQFSVNPGRKHWNEAKRTLRYLGNTINYCLYYGREEPNIKLWSDADWAGDTDDRHSFTGTIAALGGNIFDWKASKQKCIATSTMEAEYIAMSNAAKEANWLQMFIKELQLEKWIGIPYELFCDNRAAIDFAKNRIERSKTKHIDIAFHNVREKIDNGVLILNYVPSVSNVADILTKAMSRKGYEEHIERLGLKPFEKLKSGGMMRV